MDIQQQLFGLIAVAEEQQAKAQAAVDALAAERRQLDKSITAASTRLESSVRDACEEARIGSYAVVQGITSKITSVAWRIAVAVIVAVIVVAWLTVWYQRDQIDSMAKRRTALIADIAEMELQVERLEKKGGRIVIDWCNDGGKSRLCIPISTDQGLGQPRVNGVYVSQDKSTSFVIPKGY